MLAGIAALFFLELGKATQEKRTTRKLPKYAPIWQEWA
jgi:hypothetical protein